MCEWSRGGREGKRMVEEKGLASKRSGVGAAGIVQGWRTPLGMWTSRGTRRFCTFCLMTLLCTGRVWACLRCCMPAAETLLASHAQLLGPMWWAQPGKIMPSATASANYCNRSLMGSAGSRSMTSFSLQIFLGMLARQIKKNHLITKFVSS